MKIINILALLCGYRIGDIVMMRSMNTKQRYMITSFYFNFIEFRICCKLQRLNKDGVLTTHIFDGYAISGYQVAIK